MDAYPDAFKHLEGPVQLGTTIITFRARSPNSKLNEICRMTITAVQQQPPEVVYCPESFVIQLDEGETARLVYWKEPAFRATGHLKQVYKSKQPGEKFTLGEHYVSYVATDAEGQSSKCNFKVTLKGLCLGSNRDGEWLHRISAQWIFLFHPLHTEAPSPAAAATVAVAPITGASVPAMRHSKTMAGGVGDHESYLLCPGRQPMRIPPNHNVSMRIRLGTFCLSPL